MRVTRKSRREAVVEILLIKLGPAQCPIQLRDALREQFVGAVDAVAFEDSQREELARVCQAIDPTQVRSHVARSVLGRGQDQHTLGVSHLSSSQVTSYSPRARQPLSNL